MAVSPALAEHLAEGEEPRRARRELLFPSQKGRWGGVRGGVCVCGGGCADSYAEGGDSQE